MHEIHTYEEALRKSQNIESDNDWNTQSIHKKLEERIDMMQKTICNLSLKNENLWCTIYMVEGHTKDTCQHREDKQQEA